MSEDIVVFASSEDLPETGTARLVIQATRTEIEEHFQNFKGHMNDGYKSAAECRKEALWLYDANACERMGYETWSEVFKEFTGFTIHDKTFYRLVRWAEWEGLLETSLKAGDVAAVSKLVRQFGIDLVKDANERLQKTKEDSSSRLSLNKEYETNLRKFIELKLGALPTADPRKVLLEKTPKPAAVPPVAVAAEPHIKEQEKEVEAKPRPAVSSFTPEPDAGPTVIFSPVIRRELEDNDLSGGVAVCLPDEIVERLELCRRYKKLEGASLSEVTEAVILDYCQIRKDRLAKYEE